MLDHSPLRRAAYKKEIASRKKYLVKSIVKRAKKRRLMGLKKEVRKRSYFDDTGRAVVVFACSDE
jgi:hypothetical protein